ncbi:MAG: SDR family NAD(P)-dependent oxidoreductase [Pseudomonadales bacterium]|nr:SDR family NAD(P)-dependent oxidoreductase [Pseudomonadales bacterium]
MLLTGGTGFLGRAICQQLLDTGYRIRLLIHRTPARPWQEANEQTESITANLQDLAALQQAVAGVDIIVHAAGLAHVHNGDAGAMERINVQGTDTLLQAAIGQGVKQFIYISSSLAAEAESGPQQATAYARSKLAAEGKIREAVAQKEIAAVILRPVNIYGPGMAGNIAAMIRLIGRGMLLRLPRLDTRLSLVAAEDVARAVCLALEKPEPGVRRYLLTDEQEYSISAIEAAIYQALGRNLPALAMPRVLLYGAAATAGLLNRLRGKKGGISLRTYHNLVTDNLHSAQQIREELGFFPSTTFYQQLPDIIDSLG